MTGVDGGEPMPTSLRFVTVTNTSKKPITLYPNFPARLQVVQVKLAPRGKSRPLPYDLLIGTRGWEDLISGDRIRLEDVRPWRPAMVTVKNLSSDQPVSFEIKLPPSKKRDKFKGKPTAGLRKRYTVRPLETSPRVHLVSIAKRTWDDETLVDIKPVPYIGPPMVDPPCVGSLGDDDVYVCYECGQPIVFRFRPPRPIHI
jgi:hypothetical protein